MLGLDQYMDVAPANLDFNADALLKRNVGVATANAGEFSYNPAELKAVKGENGRITLELPRTANQAEWWNDLAKQPDTTYGKKMWETLNQGGMIKAGQVFQDVVVDANGNQHRVELRPDGKVATQQMAPETSLGLGQAKKAQSLVDGIMADINAGTDFLTRSAAKAAAADKAVIVANAAANATLDGIASAQIKANTEAANSVIAAGEAQAIRVENLAKAIASVDAGGLMNKIFQTNLERQVKIDAQLNKAQDRVTELTTNPFFVAGTALHGGPDKDPLLQGANQAVRQLQDAKQASAATTNALLNGVFDMQKITRGTFEVATPTEVRAAAAEKAQAYKNEAAKAAAGQAALPVGQAKLEAAAAQDDFKNQKDILQKSIQEKTQLLNAANGSDRIALTAQIAELQARLRAADNAEKRQIDWAKLEKDTGRLGLKPESFSKVAKRLAQIKLGKDDVSQEEIASEFAAAYKLKDPMIDALVRWDSGLKNPGGAIKKWEEMSTTVSQFPGLLQGYPELAATIVPGENGYKRWSIIQQQKAQLFKTAMADPKLSDKDKKALEGPLDQNFNEALIRSQGNPEAPLTAVVDSKVVELPPISGGAPFSPWMVHPGIFLTTAGATNFSGLTDEMKKSLQNNAVAVRVAEMQGIYEKTGKTASYRDVLTSVVETKKALPTLTVQQAAQLVADIYQAGAYLNNKYLNPTAFGLPEQKDYPVEIVRESVGSTFMRIAGDTVTGAIDRVVGSPDTSASGMAAAESSNFRQGFTSRFGNLNEKTKVNLMNAADVASLLKRTFPELWNTSK